jgi:hypothetical protein
MQEKSTWKEYPKKIETDRTNQLETEEKEIRKKWQGPRCVYPVAESYPPPGPAPLLALAASIDAMAALMRASATDSVVIVGEINALNEG